MSDLEEFEDNRADLNVQSVGPFMRYPVMVNGWTVPNLEVCYSQDGVSLLLDHRFGLDLPVDIAAQVISFVANATAIALGWSCHPTSVDWSPPSGLWDASGPPYKLLPWIRIAQVGESE